VNELLEAEKANYSMRMMCRALGVARSAVYERRTRRPSKRDREDRTLTTRIKLAHRASDGVYGSPRVHEELRQGHGIRVARKRVERLMREMGLEGRHKKRFRVTTDSNHDRSIPENLVQRNFRVSKPNEVWVSDITYLRVGSSFVYLAVVIDLYSRRVVGWSLSQTLGSEFACQALMKAICRRRPSRGMVHHSDRGIQYTSHAYRSILRSYGIRESMSRRGDCWDNAVAESFFATLERELESRGPWSTYEQARVALTRYIEDFYNRRRRHSTLNYATPLDVEQAWLQERKAA
jgi:putative transposase